MMRIGKKEGRGGRGADKEDGNEQDRSPRAEDGSLTPLRATSRAHGAIRLSTSHPEQINPPHSKLRATWGSLGQLHPIAPPPRPQTRPDPDQRPIEDWEGRRLSPQTLALVENPISGWARASLARALSRSPSRMHPPSGCPKPRPGHAPKSRPRLWRGPVGREPNYKHGGWGGGWTPGVAKLEGCTAGRHTAWGAYRGRGSEGTGPREGGEKGIADLKGPRTIPGPAALPLPPPPPPTPLRSQLYLSLLHTDTPGRAAPVT